MSVTSIDAALCEVPEEDPPRLIQMAYRVELDPNQEQIKLFERHLGSARYVFNWLLGEKQENYAVDALYEKIKPDDERIIVDGTEIRSHLFIKDGKGRIKKWFDKSSRAYDHRLSYSFTKGDGSQNLTKHKKEKSWLSEIDSMTSVAACKEVEVAFDNFFRRLGGNGKPGYPRFRSKKDDRSFHVHYQNSKIKNDYIKLGKIGYVKMKEKNRIPNTKFNSVTISKDGVKWFVSVQVEEGVDLPEIRGNRSVGVDLGTTEDNFAVLSDGTIYRSPKPLKKNMRKLRNIQKKMSRSMLKNGGYDEKGKAVKGWQQTSNFVKLKDDLKRIHFRIKKIREDFLNKITTEMIEKYDVICIEDLKVSNMTRRKKGIGNRGRGFNRSMLDQGWGDFKRKLIYKAEWRGKLVCVVDTFFPSTKLCSRCGNIKEKIGLDERTYTCDKCDLVMDRDLNSSQNLLTVAASLTETLNACGDGINGSISGEIYEINIHGCAYKLALHGWSGNPTVKQEPEEEVNASDVGIPSPRMGNTNIERLGGVNATCDLSKKIWQACKGPENTKQWLSVSLESRTARNTRGGSI